MFGQTFKNDEEHLKFADKLFDEENYPDAYTHYLQLLPKYRLDPNVNFKYGTCLLHVTEDKSEALPYLNHAASNNADPRVYFFLGKAYHLLYKFNVAQGHYKTFKEKGTPADKEKYQVDLHLRMCLSGKKLLSHLTELVVEEKTRTSVSKFPYSYDLSQMGGRIIISEEFQSKLDEKREFRSMTYIPPAGTGNDVIFYASYGKDGSTGLDLYSKKRLPSGDWGEEQKLPDHINTPYDDAYGFLHSSKKVFYFCSKGHNSMGGYDIFKSSYDIATNTFGPPVNMDYKINTPDDDIMYVVDSLEQNAYFASGRASKFGYIDVYKVRVETFPLVNVLLAGNFDNKIQADDNATIKIKDNRSDEVIGVYNPKQDGKYMIILPKSGTFTFIVETENSEKIHQSQVIIPPQKTFTPLKQKIILTKENGPEQLIIQNLFDEAFSEEEKEALLAEAMQLLADPQVNADSYEELAAAQEDSVIQLDDTFKPEDILSMAETFYEDAQAEADRIKEKMEAAYAVANLKSKEAEENAAAAEEILASLEDVENPLERQQQADLAKELNDKAKDQYSQATTAFNLANVLNNEYENAQNEANESKQTFESIQSTINEKDHDKAIAQLNELKERIENIITSNPDDNKADGILAEAKAKKEEANKVFNEAKEFRDEEQKLKLRLSGLNNDLEKAKEKDKPSIQVQIDELKEQIAMNSKWADESYAKAERLDKEASALDHQAQLLLDLDDDLANNPENLSDDEKADLEKFMAQNNLQSGIDENQNVLDNIAESSSENSIAENNSGSNNSNADNSNGSNNENSNNSNGSNENGDNTNSFGNNESGSNNTSNDNGSTNEVANNENGNSNESNSSNENGSNQSGGNENNADTSNTNNNNENNTSSNTNNGNTNSVENEISPDALVEAVSKIVDESKISSVQNNSNLSEVEKLQKENEILQEWFDKYDYKIVEANKGLLETENPEDRERYLEIRKQFEKEQAQIEDRIAQNNEELADQDFVASVENVSDDYQELINETLSDLSQPEDQSTDLTETASYLSDDAAIIISENNDKREQLSIKQQELTQLQEDYEGESKDKKREKIQEEIDTVEEEIVSIKNEFGTATYTADTKELERNDEVMMELLSEVSGNVADFTTDEKYLKAEIFNSAAEKQRVKADEKIEQASKTTDLEEKSRLLEEAHALNTSAIENQREVLSLLEEMADENYVAHNIQTEKSTDLASNNESSNSSEKNGSSNENGGTTNELTNNDSNGGNSINGNNNSSNSTNENGGATNELTNNESNVSNSTNGNNNSSNTTNENGGTTNELANNENNGGNSANGNNNGSNTTNENGGTTNELTNNENNGGNSTNGNNNGSNTTNENGGTTNELTNNENNGGNSTNGNNNVSNANENGGTTNELANNGNNGSNNSNSAGVNTSNNSSGPSSMTLESFNNGAISVASLLDNKESNALNNVPDQTVEDKRYDPKNDNPDAYTVSTEVEEITYSNRSTNFDSDAANEVFAENEKVVEKINELETEKSSLNNEAQNAQTDKEREKLEGKVEKIDDKIAKQESKLHDEIKNITEAKVVASKNNLEIVKESFAEFMIPESTDLKQSEEYESTANELLAQAEKLRNEAVSEKDKTLENDMLKMANSKELEAVRYFDRAADLYVDAAFGQQEKSLSNNELEMTSMELAEKSQEIQSKSSQLTQEAIAHRDSALLAKGDEKIAMLNRAEEKEKQASTLSIIANQYSNQANKQEEQESIAQEKEMLLSELSSNDVEIVKSTNEYEMYFEAENAKNNLKIEQAELIGERLGIENLVLQQKQDVKQLENDLKSAKSKEEEDNIQEKIDAIDEVVDRNEETIDLLTEQIEELDAQIEDIESQQENVIASLPSDQQNDVKAVMISNYNKTPIKKTTISIDDMISGNFEVPDKIESDVIAMDQAIKYSDENPIPLNTKYPTGLIYKVQVGAFSKPIPNDVFSGFAPITGEQVGNLVRYRVGYFVKYDNANNAKNEIRGFGYSDAFVVAVYNGERITLAEARSIEAGTDQLANNNVSSENNAGNNTLSNTNNGANEFANNNEANLNNGNTSSNESNTNASNNVGSNEVEVDLGNGAAKTNDAAKIEGLFYTVQLGAFSSPIQATDVYNISPLVTKFVGNLYKYSTGIYRTIDDAVVRKNEVVALGNSDAFVTVYYNGEKISIAKSREIIAELGEAAFASTEDGSLKQLTGQASNSNITASDDGAYLIDLGTYGDEVPTDIANAMLLIPDYEVQTKSLGDQNNYFVGYFNSREDAEKVVELYRNNGVENLSVIAKGESTSSGPRAYPGVLYRVYLGTYEGSVPAARGIIFVELKDEGVEKSTVDGKETYYAGNKSLFSEAESVRKKFASKGVSIAEVKAFQDGVEISVEEAKALTNEL